MAHLQVGHADVLAIIFDRYYRLVLSVAMKILRDLGEAEDLMQTVFLEIFIHTPLLINAADAESPKEAQLVAALRDRKKPVEMFIYQDERREKNQPKHRYAIYQRNVDWLNFWLRDKEDPDPAKAEQYVRWRELRKLDEKDRQQVTASTP
ncbi:MAG TPA: sigma factor [Terriglobales bacterium]|nr:sigma factor [Terriglobales bacterium]